LLGKIIKRGMVPPNIVGAVAPVIIVIAAVVVHEYGLVGKGPDYVLLFAIVSIDLVAVAALVGLDFWRRRHKPSRDSDENRCDEAGDVPDWLRRGPRVS
jgi:hypothetical protein